jgi:hypothetical protein
MDAWAVIVLRLATDWTALGSNPGGSEILRTRPASYTMGSGSFPGVKRPERGIDHPPISNADVKE